MRVDLKNADRFVEEQNKEINKDEKKKPNPIFNDDDIKKALLKSKTQISRLGQGIHNEVFYNGTTLDYKGKPISAVITSDKKYI